MHTFWLTIHIASGSVGLLAGPLAMALRKRPGGRGAAHWHRRVGRLYLWCVGGLTVSALGLASLKPALWWLGLIGIATLVAAVMGWRSAPSRGGDVSRHVSLVAGSYVSFVTAFLVVNLDGLVWWFLPTVIGSPLIGWASARARRRHAVPVAGSEALADAWTTLASRD